MIEPFLHWDIAKELFVVGVAKAWWTGFVSVLRGYRVWNHYKLLDSYSRNRLSRLIFYQIWQAISFDRTGSTVILYNFATKNEILEVEDHSVNI